MKAVIMSGVGGPEVLQVAQVPTPVAGPNQVLVRVRAAGVNPIDYKLRKTGALGYGAGKILGFDAAGVVEGVGPGVTDFKVGESVFYSPDFSQQGSYAQFHVVSQDILAHMPGNLSFEEAAAVPLAGTTAYDGLLTRGQLRIGQTILIAAANGGVGSLAVQIAKAAGAYVFATASTRSSNFVRSIPVVGPEGHAKGPDRVLDYQTENWSEMIKAECPAGLDLVYDCAGQDVVSRSIGLLKPFGRIVTVVNPAGKLDEGYRRNISIEYEFVQRRRATLETLKTLLERRQIVPLIDSVLPLEQAAEAHRQLEAGGVKGKIVLKVE
ncbi:MAG TPA: NADP-dependent oxidoreductase [Phycisphaerae bacterium]|jgi:NADPH:quinone reductase-like Zn-dependent oxidoreductase